jgi:methylamine dehydrogenase heavy chain
MHLRNMLVALLALQALSAHAQSWDSIVGSVASVGEPTPHWFTVRGGHTGYVVDGDSGEVKGTMTLSLFSPALRPHLEKGRIYSYGSYYTRTYYGDRTDVVLVFDAKSMLPIKEIEIPPKSAGIGHSGMIGLVDGRFLGIWNITPAMSVSLVDVEKDEFLSEISTPGCAGVYPLGKGFLMACGSGTLQYITLDDSGKETDRVVSETFFDVAKDPVFDYAVPTANGWLFVSFDGLVFEATVDRGKVRISNPGPSSIPRTKRTANGASAAVSHSPTTPRRACSSPSCMKAAARRRSKTQAPKCGRSTWASSGAATA